MAGLLGGFLGGSGVGDIHSQVTVQGVSQSVEELQRFKAGVADTVKSTEGLASGLGKAGTASALFEGALGGLVAQLAGVAAGFLTVRKAAAFLEDSFTAFSDQEEAFGRLDVALKVTGDTSARTRQEIGALGDAMQRTTTLSDEQVVAAAAQISALSGLSGDALPKATQAAIALSGKLGTDLSFAAQEVAKIMAGGTSPALKRLGIDIGDNLTPMQKLQVLTVAVSGGLEQLQAKAGTARGEIAQLGNQFNEVQESIGGVIAAELQQSGALVDLKQALIDNRAAIAATAETAALLLRATLALTSAFAGWIQQIIVAEARLLLLGKAMLALGRLDISSAQRLFEVASDPDLVRNIEEAEGELALWQKRTAAVEGLLARSAEHAKTTLELYAEQTRELVKQKGIFAVFGATGAGPEIERERAAAAAAGAKEAARALQERLDALREEGVTINENRQKHAELVRELQKGVVAATAQARAMKLVTASEEEFAQWVVEVQGGLEAQKQAVFDEADLLSRSAQIIASMSSGMDGFAQALGQAASIGLELQANLKRAGEDAENAGKLTEQAWAAAAAAIGGVVAQLGGVGQAIGGLVSGAAGGFLAGGVPGLIVGGIGGLIGGLFGGGDDKERLQKNARDFARGVGLVQEAVNRLIESGDLAGLRTLIEDLQAAAASGDRGALEKLIDDVENLSGVTIDIGDFVGPGTLDLIKGQFPELGKRIEDFFQGIRASVEGFLQSNRFAIQNIEDPALQAQLLASDAGAAAAGIDLGNLSDASAAQIQATIDQIVQQLSEAAAAGLISPDQVAAAEQLVSTLIDMREAAEDAADQFSNLQQALSDSNDVAQLLGLSAKDSLEGIEATIAERFPDFAQALFGEDLTADLAEIQGNLTTIFDVFLSGTEEQQAAAEAWLELMGLTREQAIAIAQQVKDAAQQADDERRRALESQQRLTTLRRPTFRRPAETAPDLSPLTRTVATIEADANLQDIAGSNRAILAVLNAYLVDIERNTRAGGAGGLGADALNQFLSRSFSTDLSLVP